LAGRGLPVLVGCTAAGKSDVAMTAALKNSAVEIVNGDSRQLYRGMDIGTAKPGPRERGMVTHHLLDVADPDILLSAGWYAREAGRIIDGILEMGGLPLVVGGSALYLMALAGMIDPLPPRNDRLRAVLADLEDGSSGQLFRMLLSIDPESAATISPSDRVRLIRALEICLESGAKASSLRRGGTRRGDFRFIMLEADLETLRRRIDHRVDEMMSHGLYEEVSGLVKMGFRREPVLGHTIGYAELLDCMEGRRTRTEAVRDIKTNTWRYARRQRNMFQRLPELARAATAEVAAELIDWRGANGQGN